jgi:hypothetical protein
MRMKKLLLLTILLTILALSGKAQDVSLPRDVAESALKALELVPQLETRITTLEKVNKELNEAKQTPCTIAQEKVKQDLTYWLNQYQVKSSKSTVGSSEKELRKILKFTRKNGQRAIQAQCGFNHKSVWSNVWDGVKTAAPFAALWLAL